jgi:hypothetical protein
MKVFLRFSVLSSGCTWGSASLPFFVNGLRAKTDRSNLLLVGKLKLCREIKSVADCKCSLCNELIQCWCGENYN